MVKVLTPYRDASAGSRGVRRLATGCSSWLVCCPPVLPADTPAKRLADRLLPRSGWPEVAYFAVVVALLGRAGQLPARPGLVVTGLACLAGGAWCAVNFWRCRHAHCLITGAGWLALGVTALTGAGLGHSLLHGADRPAFLGVLAVGVLFEAATYLTRGSYTLAPTRDAHNTEAPSRATIKE
ncbi:MAG: hypothetical protein ACRDPH_05615 [Marmoricola sp.]